MKRHYSSWVNLLKTLELAGTFLILLLAALLSASVARVSSGNAFAQDNALFIIMGILLSGGVLATIFYISVEWSVAVID